VKQILGTGNQTINLLDKTQVVGKLQKKKKQSLSEWELGIGANVGVF
jgi:hypothetical protein